ncbi:MAG: hypothetical protein L0Y72_25605 [Gemmataceae bacterium]|nr:hypothetical protein [Gemmataceae bacterium]MCI0742423.1 hypothetical protein [Gemmataceae bacterium]
MRQLLFGSVLFGAALAGAGPYTGDKNEALAIVDKAIRAAGGEAQLAKLQSVAWKAKAVIQYGLEVGNFSGACSLWELDKWSYDGEFESKAVRGALSPQGLWLKSGEKVQEARPEMAASLGKLLYGLRAAQILLPLQDKSLTLARAGDAKVGERPAVIVKATHEAHGEMRFYFDKETGLPAKFETRVPLGVEKEEIVFECVFSDYKEADGLKRFTKIAFTLEFSSEKLSVEATVSDMKTDAKLEEKRFAKPD